MIKECVAKDGKIINIGAWEETEANPIPEGATIQERDFEYDADRGWHEVGSSDEPTLGERQAATEAAILALMEVLG